MMVRRLFPLLAAVLALAFSGCVELPGEDSIPVGGSEDEFQGGAFGGPPQLMPMPGGFDQRAVGRCPEGQIPWRFAANGADPLGEVFQEQAGEAFNPPVHEVKPIFIVSSVCGGPSGTVDDEQLRASCQGRTSCIYAPLCTGEMEVRYSCGSPYGFFPNPVLTARPAGEGNARRLELACTFTPEVPPSEERIVCVPKLCRGKSRRNTDLQCAPDLGMAVADLRSERIARPHDLRISTDDFPISLAPNLQSDAATMWTQQNSGNLTALYRAPNAVERIFENGLYRIQLNAHMRETVPGLNRGNVRTVLWFSDVWSIDGQEVETFRCVAQTFEFHQVTNTIYEALARATQIGPGCFGPEQEAASRLEAFRRLHGATNGQAMANRGHPATFLHSRAHVSTDLEGRIHVITDGFEEVTACAPNPPAFFYDEATNRFDLYSFYEQRRWATLTIPDSTAPRRFEFTHAPQITLGVYDVQVDDPVVTVYQYNNVPSRITVDVSWYAAFQSIRSPHSTAQFHRTTPGGVVSPISPDDVRLEFYLYEQMRLFQPTENLGRAGLPLLASHRVGDAGPTGTTVSVDITIPDDIRRRFFDPNRRYYISDHVPDQQFRLLVCVVTGSPQRVSLRPGVVPPFDITWQNTFWSGESNRHPGVGAQFSLMLGARRLEDRNPWFGTLPQEFLHRELNNGTRFGYYPNATPRGCQWANTAVFFRPDRYLRPVDPIVDSAWRGQVQDNRAGDASAEGNSEGNIGQTCEQLPGSARETCQNRLGSGGASTGREFRESLHNLDFFATVTEGTVLRAAGVAEMFGFQVFDNEGIDLDISALDEDGETVSPPSDSPITYDLSYDDGSLTLTLYPPFEAAADALNEGRPPASRLSWEGDDEDGLAFTYTYTKPVAVGPVPGQITMTASLGVASSLSFSYRWRRPTGESYPCDGRTEPCYVLRSGSNAANFRAAVEYCAETGGRLAAPTSQDEANAIASLRQSIPNSHTWLGGQVGTRYEDPSCAARPSSPCSSPLHDTWRWVEGDTVYRNEDGSFSGTTFASGGNAPRSAARPQALTLNPGSAAQNTPIHEVHPFICRYEPAARSHFREMGAGLDIDVFAGIGLGFCTPSSRIGICLDGSLKILNLNFNPTFTKWDWTIVGHPGQPTRRSTSTDVHVGLDLTLLSAELKATVKLWLFSVSWNILRYPGLRVLQATLYEYRVSSTEILP